MLSKINFTIPTLPKSVNSLYNIMFALRKVELKPECRLWKTEAKVYIPPFHPSGESQSGMLRLDVTLNYNFYHKNMKCRRIDAHNMIKLIQDTISEKIGIDDAYFKFGSWSSVHSEVREFVFCSLEEMP